MNGFLPPRKENSYGKQVFQVGKTHPKIYRILQIFTQQNLMSLATLRNVFPVLRTHPILITTRHMIGIQTEVTELVMMYSDVKMMTELKFMSSSYPNLTVKRWRSKTLMKASPKILKKGTMPKKGLTDVSPLVLMKVIGDGA